MPLAKSIYPILLALSFLFARTQGVLADRTRVTIGYRTVIEEEAELINFINRPYRDKEYNEKGKGINQLGYGLYLVNEPAAWPGRAGKNWYCVIKADSDKVKNAGKVYIPEFYPKLTWNGRTEEIHLWEGHEQYVFEYVESMVPNPEKALRFSWISRKGWMQQMVIPTDVVNNNELDLWAQCFETKEELYEVSSDTINWDSWEITGDPGVPSSVNFDPMD